MAVEETRLISLLTSVKKLKVAFPGGKVQIIGIAPKEVEYVILVVDHHGGREEFFEKMAVHIFHGKVVLFPVGKARSTWYGGLYVGDIEGWRHEIVHLRIAPVHIDFFRDGDGREHFTVLACRFALAEEEVATIL